MSEKIKIPFWEILKRTFAYVCNDKKMLLVVLPILVAFIVLKFVLMQTSACDLMTKDCHNWQELTLSAALVIMNMAIIINYCRRIILRDEPNFTNGRFWKSCLFYFVATLVYFLFILLPLIILIPLAVLIETSILPASNGLGLISIYIIILAEFIWIAPLLMWFPSIAVEDYAMLSIKKLFRLAKGNRNRLFWGLFLTNIPLFVLLVVIILAAGAMFGADTLRSSNSLWLLGMIVQTLNACLKGSYYAHVYQFFKFVEKKEKA